jgi:hypothetical protein
VYFRQLASYQWPQNDSGQDIYHKTGYDAAARYSLILEEIEILSSLSSFTHLFRLANQPAMRDRIHRILLLDDAIITDPPAEQRGWLLISSNPSSY